MAEKKTGKTVTVEQVGSPIRRPAEQRQTLVGLGLNKMHRRRTLERHSGRARHDPQGQSPRARRRRRLRGV